MTDHATCAHVIGGYVNSMRVVGMHVGVAYIHTEGIENLYIN